MTDMPEKQPEVESKPELSAELATYLLQKLDCEIPTNGHQDRNNLQIAINALIQIAQYNPDADGQTPDD